MPSARLSSKSQIVLPAEIRRRLGLRPGDMLHIEEQNGRIVLQKAEGSAVRALEHCCSPLWQQAEAELQALRNEWDT